MLEMVASGLRLAEAFTYSPRPILPQRQIEAIFGPEQLRNSELFLAFATHLSGFVKASTLEESKTFMERLILEDKLWEQLETSLPRYLDSQVPFSDKLQIIMAFYDVIDVAFIRFPFRVLRNSIFPRFVDSICHTAQRAPCYQLLSCAQNAL